MRCFVAIPLPEEILDALERVQAEIPVGRLMPPENLHLTLTFLGELTEGEASAVHGALDGIAANGFDAEIAGLDLFGGRRPQILHAVVRQAPGLLALHRKVVQAVRGAGVGLRRERYRPHVTLARFNRPPHPVETQRLAAFLQARGLFATGPFAVTSFALYRSVLGHGPARHGELATYPLGPAPAPPG